MAGRHDRIGVMFDASGPSPATQPDLRREPPAGDWRRGAAAVVCLTFGFDAETGMLSDASEHARDISAMSHQAYGPRVGVPRILELARHGLPATFFVPGEARSGGRRRSRPFLLAGTRSPATVTRTGRCSR
jgi:hypothetical protein